MIIIACVDDNMGMMFNRRRQSQDTGGRKPEKRRRLAAGHQIMPFQQMNKLLLKRHVVSLPRSRRRNKFSYPAVILTELHLYV